MFLQKRTSRVLLAGLLALLLASVLLGCGGADPRAAAVARVNGEEISRQELDEFLHVVYLYMPDVKEMYAEEEDVEMLENEILWFLVENRVLEQKVRELELEVDLEAIEDELELTRQELVSQVYGSEEAYQERLEELEIREETLQLVHRDTYLRWALFEHAGSRLSDDQVREFVEENPSLREQPAQVYAFYILVETEEEAQAVLADLEAGVDFVELGQEVSLDSHIELGQISSDDMLDPIFLEAAFALSPGEISDPVETPFGFHIIQITEKTEAQELSFDEVKDEAREIKKRLYFEEYLQELISEADVETFLAE